MCESTHFSLPPLTHTNQHVNFVSGGLRGEVGDQTVGIQKGSIQLLNWAANRKGVMHPCVYLKERAHNSKFKGKKRIRSSELQASIAMASEVAAAPTAPAPEAPSSKKTKATASKKPKTPKVAPAHPSYLQMSAEAIGALKDRTGSSQPAIAKWVEEKYKGVLPANFKKQLSVQLKKLSQKGKLVQIKHSYKLSDELKKPVKPAAAKTADKKKPVGKKAPKSPKPVKKTVAKSGAPKVAKPKSVKKVKVAKPAAKAASKPAAKPTALEKKVVKKAAPVAKKVVKKAAPPAKKVASAKKVAPKKPKSAKKAPKPKATPAKKAKVAA